ncbi:unnamed protein product [Tuber aestivum]|uniref:Uncharacterized protein n=1 Tax=Tuber aestivum TaxID=59557 RepID=A0A292PMC2_9PEZI|nr:unnamed protein product [Tuber aestivum]
MPRPTRASRKPPAGEEVEKANKKVATTTVRKKERKVVEREIAEKPVAPPVRGTRSRGAVEVVLETSQVSQATVASTRTSPDKPTTTRRRGQSQQPAATVAEVTTFPATVAAASPSKGSTRSTVEEVIRETPSPKKPTRATARVFLHRKQKSDSRVASAPSTPEIAPLSPVIQVPASSDAENHSPPGSAHFASSPPAIIGPARDDEAGLTTPTQTKGRDGKQRRITLEFAEDEGYTPPRARPSSVERPRLRELGVESLEPLDRLPGIGEDDLASSDGFAGDDEGGPASPTPKRANKWKLSQLVEEDEEGEGEVGLGTDLEDGDGILAISQPGQQHRRSRFGSPFQFQKGKKKVVATVTAIEVEDVAFAIYSDPNTPSPTLPDTTNAHELDEIMRPPMSSSPAQESPRHSRKRRSSSAGMGSDDEEDDVAEEHHNQAHGGKRRKQTLTRSKLAATPKPKVLQTEDLRGLLPKRKGRGRHAERDEFDLSPSSEEEEEEEEDEDELSKPAKRKPKPAKKSKPKTKSKSATAAAARITKSAWSRPLVPPTATTTATTTTTKKKYARKSTGSEKENEAPRRNKNRDDDDLGGEDEAATTSGTAVEVADGILGKEGRRKLRAAAEKFRIVDAWEMDFEDVSASTSV